jgi:hypothetical protein
VGQCHRQAWPGDGPETQDHWYEPARKRTKKGKQTRQVVQNQGLNLKTTQKQSQIKATKSFRLDMCLKNKAKTKPVSLLDGGCSKKQTERKGRNVQSLGPVKDSAAGGASHG